MQKVRIDISLNDNETVLTRHYLLADGQLPDNMQEQLQNMVDAISTGDHEEDCDCEQCHAHFGKISR